MTHPKDPQAELRAELRKLVYSPDGKEAPLELFNMDELIALFQAHQQQLLSELLGELPANPYSKRALDRRDEEMPRGKRIALENKGYGYKQALDQVVSAIEKLKQTNDGGKK